MAAILVLFQTFFTIGLFGFGGGYAILPLIQRQTVDVHGWMSLREFADILAVAQMTPGPVAINTATYVGYRVAGFWGASVATTGVVLAPALVVVMVSRVATRYLHSGWVQGAFNGLRPALIALILYSAYSVALVSFERWVVVAIAAVALIGANVLRFSPLWYIVAAAAVGGVFL